MLRNGVGQNKEKNPNKVRRQNLTMAKSKKTSGGAGRKVVPLATLEKQAIQNALKVTKDDKLKAAHMLGIGKTTLYRKLKEYGW